MQLPEYPKYSVNGVELNQAQCMTVHAALQSMAMDLKENGLGNDEHGKFMTKAYLKRIKEINAIALP
jgi:hypothetical protein